MRPLIAALAFAMCGIAHAEAKAPVIEQIDLVTLESLGHEENAIELSRRLFAAKKQSALEGMCRKYRPTNGKLPVGNGEIVCDPKAKAK